jgi:hypothetical protein
MTAQLLISVGMSMTIAGLASMAYIQLFWKEN